MRKPVLVLVTTFWSSWKLCNINLFQFSKFLYNITWELYLQCLKTLTANSPSIPLWSVSGSRAPNSCNFFRKLTTSICVFPTLIASSTASWMKMYCFCKRENRTKWHYKNNVLTSVCTMKLLCLRRPSTKLNMSNVPLSMIISNMLWIVMRVPVLPTPALEQQ